MSSVAVDPLGVSADRTRVPAIRRGGFLRGVWGCILAAVKYLVGVIGCLSPIGAVIVAGWTYRLMQRSAFRGWYHRSGLREQGMSFADFAASDEQTAAHTHYPNWIVRQNALAALRGEEFTGVSGSLPVRFGRVAAHSLWLNIKLGTQAVFNSFVLTLPGAVLMLLGWQHGWSISFNKVYEQAYEGRIISAIGIAMSLAAMLYLPMAQARQAVTGNWRSFWQFKLVRRIIRRQWWQCVALAAIYAAASLVVAAGRIAPMGVGNSRQAATMSDAQLLAAVNNAFFIACLFIFPLFVLVKCIAARIYAGGVLKLVRDGELAGDDLEPAERIVLDRLGLLQAQLRPRRHVIVRAAMGFTGLFARGGAVLVALIVWFILITQIYFSQFMVYLPGAGWLTHPLVQLPWFRFIPPGLAS